MELIPNPILPFGQYVSDTVNLAAGQWFWIYSGPILNPATDMEVQVPPGKKWRVGVRVEITETDA